MKKLFTLLFISNLFILAGFAQTPGVQWQINDRNGVGDGTALATTDSGLILGLKTIFKIDKNGLLEWKATPAQEFDYFQFIRKAADGNYYAFAKSGYYYREDFYVIKFNSTGTILWEKTLGGSQREELYDVMETADGGWVLGGSTNSNDGDVIASTSHSYDSTTSDAWLIKINGSGNIVWTKTFGGSQYDVANRIINTASGLLVACGSGSTNGDFRDFNAYNSSWLISLDNAGNVIWKQRQDNFHVIQDIVKTQNSGYVLLGDTATFNNGLIKNRILMSKIDSDGTVLWQKIYGTDHNSFETGARLHQLQDGGFTFLATTEFYDTLSFLIIQTDVASYKTDSSGNILWQKSFSVACGNQLPCV